MKPQKVWTPEKIAMVTKLGKTMTQMEIALKLGYSYTRINSICYRYSIPTVPRRRERPEEAKSDLDYSFLCRRWG